jgi:microcystin-dependent protein
MTSVLRKSGELSAVHRPTVGDVKMSLVDADHVGWLKCDGRSLSINEYRQLYDVLGFQFGGSGSSFNLPNPQGRVLGIAGQVDLSSNTWAIGDVSGSETHTLTIAEMPSHTHGSLDVSGNTNGDGLTGVSGEHIHTATDSGHTHPYSNNTNNQNTDNVFSTETAADDADLSATTGTGYAQITVDPSGNHQHTIGSTGGDQPHNNIQPTIWIGNLYVYSGRLFHNAPGPNVFPPATDITPPVY